MQKPNLIGPFTQLVTLNHLPVKGNISDDQLEVIHEAGIIVNGDVIEAVGLFRELESICPVTSRIQGKYTVIPGLIDVHTHICWAGTRARDYAMRLGGKSYLEIASQGGGIWSTVKQTRDISEDELTTLTFNRAEKQLSRGITTMEVKSGYCLNLAGELKMLKAIKRAHEMTAAHLIPTCLAAHIKPKDFNGNEREYLTHIVRDLLPEVERMNLSTRADIYIDKGAFTQEDGDYFVTAAKNLGFDVSVHADQFNPGGLQVAIEMKAISADHLESATDEGISRLADSDVIPVVLPGASMGLGTNFAPARKILDAGCSLVIASDWNPGSAPMGNLLLQAAVLGAYEHLSIAETIAAVTFRAARVLNLADRGILKPGMRADFIAFPCSDFSEILYNQGSMNPEKIWKNGKMVTLSSH